MAGGAAWKKSCTSHQFTLYANWSVTKRCFHHFRGSWSFEPGTVRKLHAGFGGEPNLDSVRLMIEENYRFTRVLTCPNLSELVLTSPHYSDHVRPSRNVMFCTFKRSSFPVLRPILMKLHILTRLIESFPMVYWLWRCIEVKLSISLGAHA